jgi:hypothetical protein
MNVYFSNYGAKVKLEDIKLLMAKLNVHLPTEYQKFISEINGGEPKNCFFEIRKFDPESTNVECYVIVEDFFNFQQFEEVWNYTKNDLEELSLFPIADVRGGMMICVRQSDAEFCELFFYDNDFGVLALSICLEKFLNLLIPKNEVDYRKYGIDFSISDESTEG